jgi:hypothetical protein
MRDMTLEIIGAGMGRTGTDSLRTALEVLGFGPCHHMFELTKNPNQLQDWQKLSCGEEVSWQKVFDGYRSQVDWPGACYWKELSHAYPNAKVILTIRPSELWYASIQKTIMPKLKSRLEVQNPSEKARLEMAHKLVVEGVFKNRLDDEQFAIQTFNKHIETVKKAINPKRLLIMDIMAGWEPLCHFLQVPIPSVSFPKKNTALDFNA